MARTGAGTRTAEVAPGWSPNDGVASVQLSASSSSSLLREALLGDDRDDRAAAAPMHHRDQHRGGGANNNANNGRFTPALPSSGGLGAASSDESDGDDTETEDDFNDDDDDDDDERGTFYARERAAFRTRMGLPPDNEPDEAAETAQRHTVVLSPTWGALTVALIVLHTWLTVVVLDGVRQQGAWARGASSAAAPPPALVPVIGAVMAVVVAGVALVWHRPQGVTEVQSRDHFTDATSTDPAKQANLVRVAVSVANDRLITALAAGGLAYTSTVTYTVATLYWHIAGVEASGDESATWMGTTGVLLVVTLAALPLYALHRVIRPADANDPLFNMVELEAMELAIDVIDGASLFSVPRQLYAAVISGRTNTEMETLLVRCGGWVATAWFALTAVRLVGLFFAHTSSECTWVWAVLDPRGRFRASLPTKGTPNYVCTAYVDSSRARLQRSFVGARLRTTMALLATPIDVAAFALRMVMVVNGLVGVRSETTEMLVKNATAVWRHIVAVQIFWREESAIDLSEEQRRSYNSAPLAELGLCRWVRRKMCQCTDWRFAAVGAGVVSLAALVLSQSATLLVLQRLWTPHVWWLLLLSAPAVLAPCSNILGAAYALVKDRRGGSEHGCLGMLSINAVVFGAVLYFVIPAVTWPMLYYRLHELPEHDTLYSQAYVLSVQRLWAVVGWGFTIGAGPLLAGGGDNVQVDKDVPLLESALASEMVMDILSGVSLLALFDALPASGTPLDSPLGRCVLAFAILEVLSSVAHAVPRGILRSDTGGDVTTASSQAVFRTVRVLVESGTVAVRLVILFRFDGALTTVFLSKAMVGLLHGLATLWRGMYSRKGRKAEDVGAKDSDDAEAGVGDTPLLGS